MHLAQDKASGRLL